MDAIGKTINATIGGVVAGKYTKGGHRYDIRVRLLPKDRTRAEQIKNLLVRNNRGEVIPLTDVIAIQEKPALRSVTRQNRERSVRIFSNLANNVSQTDALKKVEEITPKVFTRRDHVVFTGQSKGISGVVREPHVRILDWHRDCLYGFGFAI